jgi:hypothetical protein
MKRIVKASARKEWVEQGLHQEQHVVKSYVLLESMVLVRPEP